MWAVLYITALVLCRSDHCFAESALFLRGGYWQIRGCNWSVTPGIITLIIRGFLLCLLVTGQGPQIDLHHTQDRERPSGTDCRQTHREVRVQPIHRHGEVRGQSFRRQGEVRGQLIDGQTDTEVRGQSFGRGTEAEIRGHELTRGKIGVRGQMIDRQTDTEVRGQSFGRGTEAEVRGQ